MLRLSLRPNVVAAYLSATMVCALAWFAYHSFERDRAVTVQSRSALTVMDAVRAVDDRIRDANMAERDLVHTGDIQYAREYAVATDGALQSLAALRDLAASDPAVESRVDSLGYFVHLRLAELNETVSLQRDAGTSAAVEVMLSHRSNESDRKITELLDSIGAAVERNGSGKVAAVDAKTNLMLVLVVTSSLLAILLALYVNIMHSRNVRAQRSSLIMHRGSSAVIRDRQRAEPAHARMTTAGLAATVGLDSRRVQCPNRPPGKS